MPFGTAWVLAKEYMVLVLPGYIDKESWQGFEEMRRVTKKPLTARAAKMILTELEKLRTAGHDANASLDQSTNHCWADVYMPREKVIEVNKASEADKTAAYLEQQRQHRASIRRVA